MARLRRRPIRLEVLHPALQPNSPVPTPDNEDEATNNRSANVPRIIVRLESQTVTF